ncbi:longiborneol synthase [Trichoderma arundinaceum]|uniref:Longiborneol synthase n=1 Tax=Trichoderma arundinaceum TaxID=490622 RepID=A0A395NY12_TRIAR|nr:longiborneol synthase [Trichoderma arundinaceum]
MKAIPEASLATIREVVSHFISEVTNSYKIDEKALRSTPIDKLRPAVVADLKQSSLKGHLEYLDSKNQLTMACHVAADFTLSHPLEYQIIVAQLTIFFFHAEDILEEKPEVLRQLQRNVATGQPCGDPVLDWYARELTPRLWNHFDPLVANMITIACYDFINRIGIESLTKDVNIQPQAVAFPDWLRFKTGLSPMYALLALARPSDRGLPTGGLDKYIQVMPDVIIFTNIVNDVISFYKELLAGEKGNYIDMRAQREGITVLEALNTLAKEGIQVHKRVLAALEDEPEYRANFNTYAKGSAHFHTSSPRYRIRELFSAKEKNKLM